MKDAKGHGSNPHGGAAHQQGVNKISAFEPQVHEWAMAKIAQAQSLRDWAQLPNSFETDAVKRVFNELKPHFQKNAIGHRVAASKASTFAGLKSIIERGKE